MGTELKRRAPLRQANGLGQIDSRIPLSLTKRMTGLWSSIHQFRVGSAAKTLVFFGHRDLQILRRPGTSRPRRRHRRGGHLDSRLHQLRSPLANALIECEPPAPRRAARAIEDGASRDHRGRVRARFR